MSCFYLGIGKAHFVCIPIHQVKGNLCYQKLYQYILDLVNKRSTILRWILRMLPS